MSEKLPLSPEAVLLLAKIVSTWKPAARAALDPDTYEVSESVHLDISGTVKVGQPVPRRESVSWATVAALALAKCSEATRAAVVSEYHAGRDERKVRETFTDGLDLRVAEVRDGSARVSGAEYVDLTEVPLRASASSASSLG